MLGLLLPSPPRVTVLNLHDSPIALVAGGSNSVREALGICRLLQEAYSNWNRKLVTEGFRGMH